MQPLTKLDVRGVWVDVQGYGVYIEGGVGVSKGG